MREFHLTATVIQIQDSANMGIANVWQIVTVAKYVTKIFMFGYYNRTILVITA